MIVVFHSGMLKFKNQHITREELKEALKNFIVSREDTVCVLVFVNDLNIVNVITK